MTTSELTTAKQLGVALRTLDIIEADLTRSLKKRDPEDLQTTAGVTLLNIKESRKEMERVECDN